jgi:hypothetical protein
VSIFSSARQSAEQKNSEEKEEIQMKKQTLRTCLIVMLGLTTAPELFAENAPEIEGVWDVKVTIRQCGTGNLIRAVRAMNMFIHDGTLTETGANILRSSSRGGWRHLEDRKYTATFRFFRYNPDGTFASIAKVTRTIDLSHDGNTFISTGTVEDFNADNVLLSTSCPTETATRVE